MLIFLFKNNTFLIVSGFIQLLRWESISLAFEKSLFEGTDVAGMYKKCIALRQLRFVIMGNLLSL